LLFLKTDSLLGGEEIKNISQHAAVGLVKFGVSAAGTGDRGVFLRLDVKYF
jgi:hypothetical protein